MSALEVAQFFTSFLAALNDLSYTSACSASGRLGASCTRPIERHQSSLIALADSKAPFVVLRLVAPVVSNSQSQQVNLIEFENWYSVKHDLVHLKSVLALSRLSCLYRIRKSFGSSANFQ